MEQEKTKEELQERIEALESENKRLRENKEQSGSSRRRVLAGMAGVAATGAMGLTGATGSASAQSDDSDGVYPALTDPALEKLRAHRINYQSVASGDAPSNQSSSKVLTFVLDGDLP